MTDWLRSGRGAVVNALAYRSEDISDAVYRFADLLPSVEFNRKWFDINLRAAASNGRIRVVVHRPKLWQPSAAAASTKNIYILGGAAPARKLLSREVINWALRDPE